MASILIVGAGPVGLTMACELARHGVRSRIIDRLAEPSPHCRAIGVTPRTLEVWDDMGIAREMIDRGLWIKGLRSIIDGFPTHDTIPDLSDLPYAELGLPQYETESVLTRQLGRFGMEIERRVTLATLEQADHEVRVALDRADGTREDATFQYVVGCDGAHSAVRHLLDIDFEGDAFPMAFMLGDVHIDWDLPRGMALRALRLVEDNAPDMFIAIPLPESGRYRVSMLAPPELAPSTGSDHGIQSELPGPDLEHLQRVADDLLPQKARLTDLRWSSIFRISMRLAAHYRTGRCFIAGDAAHIHPPTGGQGMNTGIQDAYNLAWKLALVARRLAEPTLLESYEAERRPVGADVIARTVAASQNFGRDDSAKPDRLADTQLRVSYRASQWVREDHGSQPGSEGSILAGDRAPDSGGLRRHGVGFPLRIFDLLRGTSHVLVIDLTHIDADNLSDTLARLEKFAINIHTSRGELCRVVAVVAPAMDVSQLPDLFRATIVQDAESQFAGAYGSDGGAFLIRPDGYLGWCAPNWDSPGLDDYFASVLGE